MKDHTNFKVIIVGGGIGGLALANCLQHAGIDYTLIERRDRLDPQLGASVGVLPNGARILDQLGCYDELGKMTVSMESTATHRKDGSLIGNISDTLKLMAERTGYPVFFLDRQLLLRGLADRIIDKDKVLLNKTVQAIEQLPDKVTVHCADGTSVQGDIVAGADGTYSPTRQEMWRHAELLGDGERFKKDRSSMSAEYKCMFGISNSVPGMHPGQTDRTFAKDMSTLSYVGKEGRVFWFVFVKMDDIYHWPHIPKYTDEDAATLIEQIGSLPIREMSKVTVRNLYEAHVACNLVAVEEAEYQQWSYGRIVCLGDSIHKMTPNLGAGASSAIESAAILSNVIVRLLSKPEPPSMSSISNSFEEYQNTRMLRATRASRFSNNLTRVQALKGFKEFIYTHHVAPRADDFAAEMFSSFVIGASIVDHLPVPERSMHGTMPFNPRQGWGYEESKSSRIIRAFPLVMLGLLCLFLNLRDNPISSIISRYVADLNGERSISTYNLGSSIHSDVMYGIWLVEAARLNNKGSLIQFPILFGLALQWLGISTVAPLYFFLLYKNSPIESFRASDNRITDIPYTSTAGPLILLFGILPRYLQYCSIDSPIWQWTEDLQPYIISFTQFLLAHTLIRSSIRNDRLWAVYNDVPSLLRSIGVLVIASATFWMSFLLEPGTVSTLLEAPLSWSGLYFALGALLWLALTFRDFRDAGMVESGWASFIVGCAGLFICFGPGGMLGVGWLLREVILLSRRHKDAMTEDQISQRNAEKYYSGKKVYSGD